MKVLLLFSCLLVLSSAGIDRSPTLAEKRRAALIAEAESMGYVIEYAGRVIQKTQTCAVTSFDFSDWLSDEVFKRTAGLIYKQYSTIPPQNAEVEIAELASRYRENARTIFNAIVGSLGEVSRYEVDHNATVPSTIPWVFEKLGGYTEFEYFPSREDAVNYAMYSARREVHVVEKRLLTDLERAVCAFMGQPKQNRLSKVGDEGFFKAVTKRILADAYEGSVVSQYPAYQTHDLSTMLLRGRTGDSDVVADVCLANTQMDQGTDLFHIIPKGILSEDDDSYEYPELVFNAGNLYALNERREGVEGLWQVEGVLFRKDGVTIVERFQSQYSRCSLASPADCVKRWRSLKDYNGTITFPLINTTLVVTNEKRAQCIDQNGPLVDFPIEYHSFVVDSEKCLLKVGSRRVGKWYIDTIPEPDDAVKFLDTSTDPITWSRRNWFVKLWDWL